MSAIPSALQAQFEEYLGNRAFPNALHGVYKKWLRYYDVRTIREMLGHSDVRTTMIYTHTIKSMTIKEAENLLDS